MFFRYANAAYVGLLALATATLLDHPRLVWEIATPSIFGAIAPWLPINWSTLLVCLIMFLIVALAGVRFGSFIFGNATYVAVMALVAAILLHALGRL